MPELPEVETVRRGLAPIMEGARFDAVHLARADLRFPFPDDFAARLEGARVEGLGRRGKYLTAALSSGETLIMHLGMSGRFTIHDAGNWTPGAFHHEAGGLLAHTHVTLSLTTAEGRAAGVSYSDPRRFGFMDLAPSAALEACRHFAQMGPEPLSEAFTLERLNDRLAGRASPIKSALLDQRVVAGLGNIYVCEALWRAGVSPRRRALSVVGARSKRLYPHIISVLEEAIAAGGSSLRDFAAADGALGYFQHGFDVYDREGEPCKRCSAPISRITQSGRSSFFCGQCQR